jgi:hypothetical protein
MLTNTLFILRLVYFPPRIIGKCLIFLNSYSSLTPLTSRLIGWSYFWTRVVLIWTHIIQKEHCMTHVVMCPFSPIGWGSVVSLWSKPTSKLKWVQDSIRFDSPGLNSFWRETEDIQDCPHIVKTWADVGNDAFTPGDCHGSNISILSKSVLMWFCKWPIQLSYHPITFVVSATKLLNDLHSVNKWPGISNWQF